MATYVERLVLAELTAWLIIATAALTMSAGLICFAHLLVPV
jgi:hypothetical protein